MSLGLSLVGEGEGFPSRPREMADGSDFSVGTAEAAAEWCFSERSMGLGISSNEELSSSSESPESSLSSVNFEARSLMDAVCWFMDGGGSRRADAGAEAVDSGSGSGAFFTGEGALGEGARAAVGL